MTKDLEDSSEEKDALKEHEFAGKVVKGSGYGNATLVTQVRAMTIKVLDYI